MTMVTKETYTNRPRAAPPLTAPWLMPLLTGLTYALALVALGVLVNYARTWGWRVVNDIRYGFPRRYHVSGVVGIGDSPARPSHVIALNIERQVSILVLPGGSPEQVLVLRGPYLFGEEGQYEVPVIEIRDMTGDGMNDLILTIRGEMIVYVNTGTTFRMLTPEERQALDHTGVSSGNDP